MGRSPRVRVVMDGLRLRLAVPAAVVGCLVASACGVTETAHRAQVAAVPAITTPAPAPTTAPILPATAAPPAAQPSTPATPAASTPPALAPASPALVASEPPAAAPAVVPRTVTVHAPPPPPPAPPPPPPPVAASSPADHLVGPGVDVLVSPQAPYDCRGFGPPLPEDRAIIDPCAQPVTGVPLIDGHNHTNLLWNASTTWTTGTAVRYGGHSWRIAQTRVVDHYITYYPMPPRGAGLQIRTCQPDGVHEWVWDLVETG